MKFILIVFCGIITSFYYFPVEFTFIPSFLNTKLMLAVIGAPVFLFHMIKMGEIKISKELFVSSIIAIIFSLVGLFSVDYNHSSDYTYVSYIFSMWIWFLASYLIITLVCIVHGYVSFRLIVDYLMFICLIQCFLALAIEFNPEFKILVNKYFRNADVSTEFLNEVKRLYGIGATVDTAGIRFSIVLIMISVFVSEYKSIYSNQKLLFRYLLAFMIISGIGNIISRTTSIGMITGIVYLMYKFNPIGWSISITKLKVWKTFILLIFLVSLSGIYFYNNYIEFRNLLRFGFEGFFNWYETGTWYTDSTNKLNNEMWLWPEPNDIKTWLIGSASFTDLHVSGLKKITDIGYCRFIFYCGFIGLSTFTFFFLYLANSMRKKFYNFKYLFLLLFIMGLIVWVKVSTDLFLVYAVFLSVSSPYLYSKYYIEES